MQRNSIAATLAALSLTSASAMADTAHAELNTSWSGSDGTNIFLAFNGSILSVDGLDYSSRGGSECGCFDVPLVSVSGENEMTGRTWSTSWDGRYYTIDGHEISFSGETSTEFAIPAGGTLDITLQFQSFHGDNYFSFTDPNSVTTAISSGSTLNYSFTNTTSDWEFEWTSIDLGMTGTVPEPSNFLLMLVGVLLLGGIGRGFFQRGT